MEEQKGLAVPSIRSALELLFTKFLSSFIIVFCSYREENCRKVRDAHSNRTNNFISYINKNFISYTKNLDRIRNSYSKKAVLIKDLFFYKYLVYLWVL